MTGMSRSLGTTLDDDAHLAQSIADILTTPLGDRVMRRDYGSLLFELIDAPLNALTRLRMFAATATALRKWEPRLRLTRVSISDNSSAGTTILTIEGARTDAPAPNALVTLSIPLNPLLT